jgi:peptide/nickel transport system ATP-binding protein
MTTDLLVDIQGLNVSFGSGARRTRVVKDLSLRIAAGECVALVGESGSGKSVTARTLVGLTGHDSHVDAERIEFEGRDTRGFSERAWRRIRGAEIGFVLQDALASLDALRTVGAEVAEPLKVHARLTRRERDAEVLRLLQSVGVPEPPRLVIADEPTTALDATIAAQIIRLLGDLKADGRGLLLVSHDLSVVAALADRIAVMHHGVIVEEGTADRILTDAQHPYTQDLLAAVPSTHPRGSRLSRGPAIDPAQVRRIAPPAHETSDVPVIEARALTKTFRGPDGVRRTAVDGVDLAVRAGATLGIVGESGSGKTTTARILLGVERADSGDVLWRGTPRSALGPDASSLARRSLQVVYQDPLASFDPRYTVARVLGEALEAAGIPRGSERTDRAEALLGLVRLPSDALARRPIELSGGQRQRIAIARALAAGPAVLVCDEPVSALDVSVQAQVLDLFAALQEELGLTYVFISHDLGVVHHISDEVLVMKDGRVVERGSTDRVFRSPEHPYTRSLLAAVPRLTAAGA